MLEALDMKLNIETDGKQTEFLNNAHINPSATKPWKTYTNGILALLVDGSVPISTIRIVEPNVIAPMILIPIE